ncbi:ABC-2 family transporter protein [Plantactinospora sp. S1510]|uniref:ABC-2 family transporter protein n=1 Tax=Plantactinospora alkalitolerans TaxID=2789879 RepID=A0ABS0H159_9ACTN|nr:ABC-2 family transporter protein [Plantactinospora alkalitolerans]MBF9132200.1 ABC-2 family transporter protein [Plantactinospora alkalitolerans]
MRPYLALARASARSVLTYRLTFVFSMFGLIFQLLALLAIWHAVIGAGQVNGLTWPQMKSYLLVAFSCGALVSLYTDFGMAARIQSGMVAVDLTRPIDYQKARLAETVGGVWIELLVAALGWCGVITLLGTIFWPDPVHLLLFVLSLAAVVPLKFLVVYITGLACFWTQNYLGINWARVAVVNLLSGALIPLSFLPSWFGTVAEYLPFAGITSTPALILAGDLHGLAAVRGLLLQVVWALLLWLLARATWATAVRQLTVHGG